MLICKCACGDVTAELAAVGMLCSRHGHKRHASFSGRYACCADVVAAFG